uniref:WRKY transcription factor 48 n=1 Tax=Santalum album TaxID=35974 RepID=A0A650C2Y8_SANAL|nr:WRKY transcription factor 48 [Santalum album]
MMEGSWDLQAIVDGGELKSSTSFMDPSFVDLEEIYQPFFPLPLPLPPTLTQPVGTITAATTPSRKRKNLRRKEVHKVITSEGPSSDKWAWRKYGQKPIKGSPYPRSYYRCSSSKDCLARKQVERSQSNPDTFIISYASEHDHPFPTRRSSLAGTTRNHNKPSAAKTTAAAADSTQTVGVLENDDSNPPCSSHLYASTVSPTDSAMASSVDGDGRGNVDEFLSGIGLDDGFLSFDDFSEAFSY